MSRSGGRRVVVAPTPAWVAGGGAVAVAVALYAAAIALAHDVEAFGPSELIRGETPAFFTVMVGGTGVFALVIAVFVGARGGVGPAVAVLLVGWAVALVGAGPHLRADFVLVGAGHLVLAELAYWSIERRTPPGPDRGSALATRAAELVALLAVVAVATWVLAGALAGRAGGAGLDLLAVLVVLGFGAVVVGVVRRA